MKPNSINISIKKYKRSNIKKILELSERFFVSYMNTQFNDWLKIN